MVDATELDYIRTFLGKVHTTATVKHITETRSMGNIADDSRMLVLPGELVFSESSYYKKRYKVRMSEITEVLLMTALNNIIDGISKLNRRQAIAAYTRPAILHNIKLSHGTRGFEEGESKVWYQDIYLDIEWGTS